MSVPTPGVFRYNRPERGYSPIANQFSRSKLPARAIKVGLYVLSHRDGFVQTQDQIAAAIGLNVSTVRAALGDLEAHRFLVRHEVRGQRGERTGTAYGITDVPFTDQEIQTLTGKSPGGDFPGGDSPGPKKTRSRRDTTKGKKTTPSGGSPTGERGAPATATEEPVKHPPDALALDLELPAPAALEIRPRQNGKNAAAIVAGYVDSYRRNHSGGDPVQRDKGRVARDAAELLRTGRATFEELAAAAETMGAGRYSNLGVQLNIVRERGKRTGIARGPVPVSPREGFAAAAAEQHAKFVDEIRNDPDVARWVADDPAAVERLCAEHPDLRTVFERVAAA